jgi:glycosyltransferase involved in cell wall biosynthesis
MEDRNASNGVPGGLMVPARVLVVGVNYAPEHSGNAPYTTGLAEHLAARGHDVTVLTAMPHYPAWRVAPEYAGRWAAREERNGVHIERRAIYVPAHQSALRRAAYEASFVLAAGLAAPAANPDVVIGVTPSLGGAMLARLFAARWHAPYGVVVQDLVGPAASQSGIAGGGRVTRATGMLERWALTRARVVAPVSEAFVPYLLGLGVTAERLMPLRNWTHIAPPREDRDAVRARLGWDDGRQVVLHAGNMGLKQDLGQVLRAAALAAERNQMVRFVLLGDGSQRGALEREARGIPNVEFLDPVPDDEFSDILAAADVLLVTERPSVRDMSLPSKLTSYAAAARPVVAAVMPDGATAREVTSSGIGLVTQAGDAPALLGALRRLAHDPELAAGLAEAGPRYVRDALDAPRAGQQVDLLVDRLRTVGRRPRTAEATAA